MKVTSANQTQRFGYILCSANLSRALVTERGMNEPIGVPWNYSYTSLLNVKYPHRNISSNWQTVCLCSSLSGFKAPYSNPTFRFMKPRQAYFLEEYRNAPSNRFADQSITLSMHSSSQKSGRTVLWRVKGWSRTVALTSNGLELKKDTTNRFLQKGQSDRNQAENKLAVSSPKMSLMH